jgi:hypothetical protein
VRRELTYIGSTVLGWAVSFVGMWPTSSTL